MNKLETIGAAGMIGSTVVALSQDTETADGSLDFFEAWGADEIYTAAAGSFLLFVALTLFSWTRPRN